MKWITHQAGAILAASASGLGLPGIGAAIAGAIMPDYLDQLISKAGKTPKQKQRIFNQIHRGTTHWPGWWLLLFCSFLALPLEPLVLTACAGFALGGISHIALDMLTPQGIPWRPFSRRGKLALPICSTGKIGEYIFLTLICCGIGCFWANEMGFSIAGLSKIL